MSPTQLTCQCVFIRILQTTKTPAFSLFTEWEFAEVLTAALDSHGMRLPHTSRALGNRLLPGVSNLASDDIQG